MIPPMADGEIPDPRANEEPAPAPAPVEEVLDVIFADPEPMDDEEEPQDVDEVGGAAEVGLDEELGPEDNLKLYLDPEIEFDSEDERVLAEDMEVEQSESRESSSEEPSDDATESSDPDWDP